MLIILAVTKIVTKDQEIKKELSRLHKIFKNFDSNKKSAIEGLVHEAAFMRVTLNHLKNEINANGAIDEMAQGSYSILRESPAIKTYNTMIQRYTTVCKELFSLLPKEQPKPKNDGFEDFVDSK